jgi:hypothetical protein
MTDWGSIRMRSRAAQTLPDRVDAPMPVVSATPEGDHPLGDATLWGNESSTIVRVTPTTPDGPLSATTGQLIRTQVADRHARRWRWGLQVELSAVPGEDIASLSISQFLLDFTFGTGLVATDQSLDIIVPALASILLGWQPVASATRTRFFVHDLGPLTDVLGEQVSCRLRILYEANVEVIGAVQLGARMFIQPQAVSS